MGMVTSDPLLSALAALLGLGVVFGSILGYASVRFRTEGNPLVDQINQLLPQTQCGQCGYPGCKPYATAIADGDAINSSPRGVQKPTASRADLLDVDPQPLDAEHGEEKEPNVAYIREEECIGCTKCIQACPVDAILGAAKLMHTVIANECTGCDLCVEPCPVDCIDMIPRKGGIGHWRWELPTPPEERPDIIVSDREAA